MNYCIYQLKFLQGVHFGESAQKAGLESTAMTCHADTLFSALTQECLALYDERTVWQWVEWAQEGKLLLSSLMPYDTNHFYLPRPHLPRRTDRAAVSGLGDPGERKRMNQLRWIPIDEMHRYMAYIGGADYKLSPEPSFGRAELLKRVNLRDEEKSQPYAMSAFYFHPDVGLYVIVGCEEPAGFKLLDTLFHSLALTGLGGKRNLGMGCFKIQRGRIDLSERGTLDQELGLLAEWLSAPESRVYMAISPVLPHEEERSGIKERLLGYSLLERRGFIQSEIYREQNLKRRPCVMLEPGFCVTQPVRGCVLDLRPEKFSHAVYRYGMGMYISLASGNEVTVAHA